jgi:hypothetical protein
MVLPLGSGEINKENIMDPKELARIVAIIVETIAVDEIPSGILYAGLMNNLSLDGYHRVMAALYKDGIAEELPGHVIRATEKGKNLAAELTAIRAKSADS